MTFTCARTSWAVLTPQVLLAAAMASSPQQTLTCWWRLLVDFASPMSRNWWTSLFLLWQLLATHSNTCALWASIYSIIGISLKNTYIGVSQSLLRWCSGADQLADIPNLVLHSPSSSLSSSTLTTLSSGHSPLLTSISSGLDSWVLPLLSPLLCASPLGTWGWAQGGEAGTVSSFPLAFIPFLLFWDFAELVVKEMLDCVIIGVNVAFLFFAIHCSLSSMKCLACTYAVHWQSEREWPCQDHTDWRREDMMMRWALIVKHNRVKYRWCSHILSYELATIYGWVVSRLKTQRHHTMRCQDQETPHQVCPGVGNRVRGELATPRSPIGDHKGSKGPCNGMTHWHLFQWNHRGGMIWMNNESLPSKKVINLG